jgi:hypothetical protein
MDSVRENSVSRSNGTLVGPRRTTIIVAHMARQLPGLWRRKTGSLARLAVRPTGRGSRDWGIDSAIDRAARLGPDQGFDTGPDAETEPGRPQCRERRCGTCKAAACAVVEAGLARVPGVWAVFVRNLRDGMVCRHRRHGSGACDFDGAGHGKALDCRRGERRCQEHDHDEESPHAHSV